MKGHYARHVGLVLVLISIGGCANQISMSAGEANKSAPPERLPDGVTCDYCQTDDEVDTEVVAFPGAEGFGAKTIGGRGGQVIEVTNLNEEGPGSLRAAVEAVGARTVVFRVGGTIKLTTPIQIENPYITIAGQSAPGGGIAIRGDELRVQAPEANIRHLRMRIGDRREPDDTWENADAANAGSPDVSPYNIIFDHCSFSWSVDEALTFWYGTHDFTVQYSIVSEPLYDSFHPKGPHSMSLLVGRFSTDGSIHHSAILHGNQRVPQLSGKGEGVLDFVNNVIYNSGEKTTELEDANLRINIVNNYYKNGPDSGTSFLGQEITADDIAAGDMQLYIEGNIGPHAPTGNEDNWDMVSRSSGVSVSVNRRASSSHEAPPITTVSAAAAVNDVLDHAGATKPLRDSVDTRVTNEARNGTGRIIDSQADVGGWPTLAAGTAPADADHDGMPDSWESARGLNPNDIMDTNKDRDGDGYTNLEEYLNYLADN